MVNHHLYGWIAEEFDFFALLEGVDEVITDFVVLKDVLHVYELQVHRLQCSAFLEQFCFYLIFTAENLRHSPAILSISLQLKLVRLLEEVLNFL